MVTKALVNVTDLNGEKFVVLGFAMLIFEWIFRERAHEFQMKENGALAYRGVRWALYLIFMFLCIRFSGIDITYIPLAKGFMYLTAIIDIYSRFIVGWSLHNTLGHQTA